MRSSVLFLALMGCEWTAPVTDDAVPGAIEGTLIVTDLDDWADAFVALYPADDLPPPYGLGTPVALTAVSADSLMAGTDESRSASFLFSTVPAGRYVLTGLLDVDADFHPMLASNAGATCGDGAGAHVTDLSAETLAVVDVREGEHVTDRTVVIGAALPIERPGFFLSDAGVSPTTGDALFTVQATGIASSLVHLSPPGTQPCDVAFLVQANDANDNGRTDPHPDPSWADLGAVDAWPRVVVTYLGDGATPLAEGERYQGLATVDTSTLDANTPTPLTTLSVAFPGQVRHTLPDGRTEVVDRPPSGSWQVEVIQMTGQSWVVPNETATEPATDPSFDPLPQGVPLSVL